MVKNTELVFARSLSPFFEKGSWWRKELFFLFCSCSSPSNIEQAARDHIRISSSPSFFSVPKWGYLWLIFFLLHSLVSVKRSRTELSFRERGEKIEVLRTGYQDAQFSVHTLFFPAFLYRSLLFLYFPSPHSSYRTVLEPFISREKNIWNQTRERTLFWVSITLFLFSFSSLENFFSLRVILEREVFSEKSREKEHWF